MGCLRLIGSDLEGNGRAEGGGGEGLGRNRFMLCGNCGLSRLCCLAGESVGLIERLF